MILLQYSHQDTKLIMFCDSKKQNRTSWFLCNNSLADPLSISLCMVILQLMQFIETHRTCWCIPMVSLPRKKNGHMTSIPSMKRGRLLCGAVWERQALQMLPALHSKLQGPHTLVSFFYRNMITKFLDKDYHAWDQKKFTGHAHSLTPISRIHLSWCENILNPSTMHVILDMQLHTKSQNHRNLRR